MPDYRALASLDEVKYMVDHIMSSPDPVAFDTETGYMGELRNSGSLRVYEAPQLIAGLSLTNSAKWARYLPLAHDHHKNLPKMETWEVLRPVFEERTILAHNLLFDLRNLQALPIKGDGPEIKIKDFEDTLLMSYVLGKTEYHGLKHLTMHYFDYEQSSLKSLFPAQESWSYQDAKKLRFNELAVTPDVTSYVCDDSRWVIGLKELFDQEFAKEENARLRFIYKMEKEIMLILADMQNTGLGFDWDKFDRDWAAGTRLHDFMTHEVRTRFLQELGKDKFDDVINFNSTQQMRKLLYEDLELTTGRFTKTGALSVDQITLKGLASQSRGAAKLAEHKKYLKGLGFYETWDQYRDSYDGRIHSNLSQTMVQSGRFASNDPNIQNIKKEFWFQVPDGDKDELLLTGKNGKDFWTGSQRGYVIPSEDFVLFSFDYSQGELRVLAGVANEPYLKEAFDTGLDIHTATASMMFGIAYDQVTKTDRAAGKTLNFGLIYGMGAKLLAEHLNVSYEEGMRLMDQYFSAFKNVKKYVETKHAHAHLLGYSDTFMGRRVSLWDMVKGAHVADNGGFISKAERLALNSSVQGGLADIVKVGMIRTARALKEKGWWGDAVRLLMNQHDSLVFEVHKDLPLTDVYDIVKPAVEINPSGVYPTHDSRGKLNNQELNFPTFVTDWEYGDNWGEMREFVR